MLYIAPCGCYLHHHTCSSSSLLYYPQLNGEISKPEVGEVTRRIKKYWTNERKWEREEEKLMGKGPREPSSHLRIHCAGASSCLWLDGACQPCSPCDGSFLGTLCAHWLRNCCFLTLWPSASLHSPPVSNSPAETRGKGLYLTAEGHSPFAGTFPAARQVATAASRMAAWGCRHSVKNFTEI